MTTSGTDAPTFTALQPGSQSRRRVFPGRARQLAAVRRYVGEALVGHDKADDAVLLVTELAANAIQHTATGSSGGTFAVTICLRPGAARIIVTDNGATGVPVATPPDPTDVSGRGLALVQALADAWGHQGDQHGRSVWFDIGLPADVQPGSPAQPGPVPAATRDSEVTT